MAVIAVLFIALPTQGARAKDLRVISFNIQFLGHFLHRRDADLADMLAPYDLVFVQELVAPPEAGTYPDGTTYDSDSEAKAFFDAMEARGFEAVLSEEDTAPNSSSHTTGPASEWYVAFFEPGRVAPAPDLFTGFLADDRFRNPDYDRVPYAFGFRTGEADLIFISVHLHPDQGPGHRNRRTHELASIFEWIDSQTGERDFVVLGDMNFEGCAELDSNIPDGYASLNKACQATNTTQDNPRPYDNVLYRPDDTAAEINVPRGVTVLNLIEEMRLRWPSGLGPFPGDPYDHDAFRVRFSDHHPIRFRVRRSGAGID